MRRRLAAIGDRLRAALSLPRVRDRIRAVERKLGITRTGELVLLMAVVLWIIGRIVAGTVLYLLAYGIVLLVVVAYASSRRKLPLLGDRTDPRPRANENELLHVGLRLSATRRLSTLVLEEALPERLGKPVRLPIATLESGAEIDHDYRINCTRRGSYELGPLVARWGDPFGLTQREQTLAESFELLVHPSIETVSDRPLTRQFEDPPIRPPVSKPWPSGLEFYGMREYQAGDDLRRVVWRALARTGKVMVREAEQGITDHITVLIDTDRTFHSPEDPSESFETAVRVAASLAVKHLREGYAVAIETNAGPLTHPLRGAASQISALDALARVGMDRTPLTANIMRRVTDPRRDAHNVLVTPKLGQKEAAQLRLLLNKGVSVLVVALVWEEESAETLNVAAALGCQVVEVRPGQSIGAALSLEVGAGRR